MVNDPVADFLIRIKNGYLARKKIVEIPYSKIKEELGKILAKEGYLLNLEREGKKIRAILKYEKKEPSLTQVERVSKPGLKVYARKKKIPLSLGGIGIVIISTPQGLMTDKEARKKGLGGEIICKIW